MSKRRKFLIDCDPGTDDAQAILMALAADDVDVLAITTVAGNSSVDVTSRNALRLLKFCNRMDIPVFKGCATSLKGNALPYKRDYFGLDGMGDVIISNVDPIDPNLIQSEPAPNAICRIVNENPGSITLVALGPLTNLAICQHLDPHFGTKLGNIVVMGGNFKGLGNASMFGAAEFNWWTDPEAANVLLNNLKTMITIVPLETCLENAFEWEFYEKLTSLPSRRAILVKSIDRVFIEHLTKEKSSKYKVFDQLAMAVALRPAAAIVEAKDTKARVELRGDETRGQMVVNWYEEDSSKFNIRLVTKVNSDVCKQMLMDAVART